MISKTQNKQLSALVVKTLAGLTLLLLFGVVLVLLFSEMVSRFLPKDATILFLGLLGYVAVEIFAAFSRWMSNEMRSEESDNRKLDSLEKPDDYAPGVPPKIILHH